MKAKKPKPSPVTAEILKVLSLKKDCYYLVLIPTSTGLSLDTLQTINDELARDGYNFILVQTRSNEGIEVIERNTKEGEHA